MSEQLLESGYCVGCKNMQKFIGTVSTTDSGRSVAVGDCLVCGTKMKRILGGLRNFGLFTN